MIGIGLAIAVPLCVDYIPHLETRLDQFFGFRESQQFSRKLCQPTEAEKYTPQKQISENPHHYIPNPK